MSGTTPVLGIHHPTGSTKQINLGDELAAMAADIEAKLLAADIPPVTPAPIMATASAAARDAFWGVPGNEAARITLQNRGATTIRTDKGWTERYFATYNATTNPAGATVPGWYPVEGVLPEINLVPSGQQALIAAPVMVTSWSAPGAGGSYVRGAEFFNYAGGVVTCARAGRYRVSVHVAVQNANGQAAAFYITKNGTSNVVTQETVLTAPAYGTMAKLAAEIDLAAGDTLRVQIPAISAQLSILGAGRSAGEFFVQFLGPAR